MSSKQYSEKAGAGDATNIPLHCKNSKRMKIKCKEQPVEKKPSLFDEPSKRPKFVTFSKNNSLMKCKSSYLSTLSLSSTSSRELIDNSEERKSIRCNGDKTVSKSEGRGYSVEKFEFIPQIAFSENISSKGNGKEDRELLQYSQSNTTRNFCATSFNILGSEEFCRTPFIFPLQKYKSTQTERCKNNWHRNKFRHKMYNNHSNPCLLIRKDDLPVTEISNETLSGNESTIISLDTSSVNMDTNNNKCVQCNTEGQANDSIKPGKLCLVQFSCVHEPFDVIANYFLEDKDHSNLMWIETQIDNPQRESTRLHSLQSGVDKCFQYPENYILPPSAVNKDIKPKCKTSYETLCMTNPKAMGLVTCSGHGFNNKDTKTSLKSNKLMTKPTKMIRDTTKGQKRITESFKIAQSNINCGFARDENIPLKNINEGHTEQIQKFSLNQEPHLSSQHANIDGLPSVKSKNISVPSATAPGLKSHSDTVLQDREYQKGKAQNNQTSTVADGSKVSTICTNGSAGKIVANTLQSERGMEITPGKKMGGRWLKNKKITKPISCNLLAGKFSEKDVSDSGHGGEGSVRSKEINSITLERNTFLSCTDGKQICAIEIPTENMPIVRISTSQQFHKDTTPTGNKHADANQHDTNNIIASTNTTEDCICASLESKHQSGNITPQHAHLGNTLLQSSLLDRSKFLKKQSAVINELQAFIRDKWKSKLQMENFREISDVKPIKNEKTKSTEHHNCSMGNYDTTESNTPGAAKNFLDKDTFDECSRTMARYNANPKIVLDEQNISNQIKTENGAVLRGIYDKLKQVNANDTYNDHESLNGLNSKLCNQPAVDSRDNMTRNSINMDYDICELGRNVHSAIL